MVLRVMVGGGMNDVTREWWIPVLKRGCPMKDGKIYNKNKYLSQLVPVFGQLVP